jgi:3,4-dihydroxy 2-butanone 4-phosphate synthase/GTP cyclohydrolase II
LRSRPGGVLKRAGHTETASDLAQLAGLGAAGVLSEVVSDDKRRMAGAAELPRLAEAQRLPMIAVSDLVRYRFSRERLVERIAEAQIPTRHGRFTGHGWRSSLDGTEHLALTLGDVSGEQPVLVRVHSECLPGNVLRSRGCECRAQLDDALARIAAEGRGVVVYLRGQEGRGVDLDHRLIAHTQPEAGRADTDADRLLTAAADDREHRISAQILMDLGVRRMRLMNRNPERYEGLAGDGLEIVEPLAHR